MVALCARCAASADPDAAAARALQQVGLDDVADRKLRGFSHGMRQRVKLAQALAHDPELLLLDEPLNGLDPAQRRGVVELITRLGDEGRTVLVSSHVLHEVERMAPAGAGAGQRPPRGERRHDQAIRELIADRPRSIRLEAGTTAARSRRELVGAGLVESVRFDDGAMLVESGDVERLGRALPRARPRRRRPPAAGRAGGRRPRERLRLPARARPGGRPVIAAAPRISLPVYRLTLRSLFTGKKVARPGGARAGAGHRRDVFASAGEIEPELFWARMLQRLVIPTITAFIAVVIGASAIARRARGRHHPLPRRPRRCRA